MADPRTQEQNIDENQVRNEEGTQPPKRKKKSLKNGGSSKKLKPKKKIKRDKDETDGDDSS